MNPEELVIRAVNHELTDEIPIMELVVSPYSLAVLAFKKHYFPECKAVNQSFNHFYSLVRESAKQVIGLDEKPGIPRLLSKLGGLLGVSGDSEDAVINIARKYVKTIAVNTKIDLTPYPMEVPKSKIIKNGREYLIDVFGRIGREEGGQIIHSSLSNDLIEQRNLVLKGYDCLDESLNDDVSRFKRVRDEFRESLCLTRTLEGPFDSWNLLHDSLGNEYYKLVLRAYRGRERDFSLTELLERKTSYYEGLIPELSRAGSKVIIISEDIATNDNVLINPDWFKAVFIPYLSRIVSRAHDNDIKVIYHTDGDVTPFLSTLKSAGIDALHPLENRAMNVMKFKREHGKDFAMITNVCNELTNLRSDIHGSWINQWGSRISEKHIHKMINECLPELVMGGGYIFTSGNSIADGINNLWDGNPVSAVLRMHDIVKDYKP